MEIDSIKAKLATSLNREICVDARIIKNYPGYVRRIYLRKGNLVSIEFELYNIDEGGAYFQKKFNVLEEAIACIEYHIESKHSEWEDKSSVDFYSIFPSDIDFSEGHKNLQEAIRNRSIALPKDLEFELVSSYWKQFEQ